MLHPIFEDVVRGYMPPANHPPLAQTFHVAMRGVSQRPELTALETQLLRALQLMKGWVVHYTEPHLSGRPEYSALVRDMRVAESAISNATGGNEQ